MDSFLKVDGEWLATANAYLKENGEWVEITDSEFIAHLSGKSKIMTKRIEGDHGVSIFGVSAVTGESYTFSALYDNMSVVTSACTWSIVSGSTYATIGSGGVMTILSTSTGSSVIVRAVYRGLSDNATILLTYMTGTTASTETEVVTDESGNTTTTTTTVIENEDGSSSSNSTTTVTDESGNTIGTQESIQNNNSDGSFDSTTTSYDENGNPTETTNASGDTDGNVSTQEIEYNESGTPVVTSYVVDTSNNPDGNKTYNGDGTNTEYYAFDMTRGFVLHIHFYFNFTKQPSGQNENHHNILTMKRATPSPWYGFQIRQTGTNKYLILGTQFATGSNTNTNLTSASTATANTSEYDLTITYNPTASTNTFVCYNNLTHSNVYTSNLKFPDIDELKYLKVTIGCAMDENGNMYRFSNIDISDFTIHRI